MEVPRLLHILDSRLRETDRRVVVMAILFKLTVAWTCRSYNLRGCSSDTDGVHELRIGLVEHSTGVWRCYASCTRQARAPLPHSFITVVGASWCWFIRCVGRYCHGIFGICRRPGTSYGVTAGIDTGVGVEKVESAQGHGGSGADGLALEGALEAGISRV